MNEESDDYNDGNYNDDDNVEVRKNIYYAMGNVIKYIEN